MLGYARPVDAGSGFGQPFTLDDLREGEAFGTRAAYRNDSVWLAMGGELDVFTAPTLRTALETLEMDYRTSLVLDLRGITFVDSSGLAVILGAHERASGANAEPVRLLIKGSAPVESLFQTIGAYEYLNVIDDPAELASADPEPSGG